MGCLSDTNVHVAIAISPYGRLMAHPRKQIMSAVQQNNEAAESMLASCRNMVTSQIFWRAHSNAGASWLTLLVNHMSANCSSCGKYPLSRCRVWCSDMMSFAPAGPGVTQFMVNGDLCWLQGAETAQAM